MTDWAAGPTILSLYTDVLDLLKNRDIDSYTLAEAPVNPPVGAIRYNRGADKFQEWDGAAWQDLILSTAGGGTGGVVIPVFGTMATQNASGVAITGGSITGITTFTFNCDLIPDTDGSRDVGSLAKKIDTVYIKNGLLIPVGNNKYVTT